MSRVGYIIYDESREFADRRLLQSLELRLAVQAATAPARRYLNDITPATPAPPPPDMPIDPAKWAALDRRARRALLCQHRKTTGR